MTNEPRVPRPLTRRALLGGVGAAGVALPTFLASTSASATASGPPVNVPTTVARNVRGRGFGTAAVTSGVTYQTFTGTSFRRISGDVSFEAVGARVAADATELFLPFEHPNFVVIEELEVYVQEAPAGGTAQLVLDEASTNFRTNIGGQLALPAGGITPQTASAGYLLDVDASHDQAGVVVQLDTGALLLGTRIGYEDFTGLTFFPVDPSRREIDTRGIRSRLVSFETYRVALEVPPFAYALLNLTVTQTIGAGFLSAFPADINWPGTSSINWFQANQDTANLVVVGTDASGAINLYCGAGQTHVVVDLEGFYY